MNEELTASDDASSLIGCADAESEADFSCGFDGPWFGAGYPDAYCVDGYLHDADDDGYFPDDTEHPCPRCNTREFLERKKELCDGTEFWSVSAAGYHDEATGDELWERAKAWARKENPANADDIIAHLVKLDE